MDPGELKRLKEVIHTADQLTNEIARLREAVAVGLETNAVKFIFDPFAILVEQSGDVDRLSTACSARLVEDLAAEFRTAFVDIVKRRLAEREEQLADLTY